MVGLRIAIFILILNIVSRLEAVPVAQVDPDYLGQEPVPEALPPPKICALPEKLGSFGNIKHN